MPFRIQAVSLFFGGRSFTLLMRPSWPIASVLGFSTIVSGDVDAARDAYREAVRRATSRVEQRHLEGRARRLASGTNR